MHAGQCEHREIFLLKPWFHHLQNSLSTMLGWLYLVPWSLQTSTGPESICNANRDSLVKSTEAHSCLVHDTCSLAQRKRSHLCRPFKETHINGRLAYIYAFWRRLHNVVAEILLPYATKWSASSWCTAVILLIRTESARKRSSAGVTRGRSGTGLLDTESFVWNCFYSRWTKLRDTMRRLAASAYDNPVSIHWTDPRWFQIPKSWPKVEKSLIRFWKF